jgi:hypothetical protein
MLRSNSDNTPYELWKGRPKNVKHFKVFGSKCYIKREDGKLGKFDSRVDKGILVGYSRKIKEYKCVVPWLWKEVKNEEEKVKSKLRERHSDCHWVEVSKREEKMEQSTEMKFVG